MGNNLGTNRISCISLGVWEFPLPHKEKNVDSRTNGKTRVVFFFCYAFVFYNLAVFLLQQKVKSLTRSCSAAHRAFVWGFPRIGGHYVPPIKFEILNIQNAKTLTCPETKQKTKQN